MMSLTLRPIVVPDDLNFLFQVYASTRLEELAPLQWSREQLTGFLTMQFNAQHTDYTRNYPDAAFDIVLVDDHPAGRLYVHRRPASIHVIDIALLPAFRSQGIGSHFLKELIAEGREKKLPVGIYVEYMNPAQHLYTRLGFKKISDAGVYFYMECSPETTPDAG